VWLPIQLILALADVQDPVSHGVGDVKAAAQVARLKRQTSVLVNTFRQLLVLEYDPIFQSF